MIMIRMTNARTDEELIIGPLPFVQFTYGSMRVGEDGGEFPAQFADGFWHTDDGRQWTDVCVYEEMDG